LDDALASPAESRESNFDNSMTRSHEGLAKSGRQYFAGSESVRFPALDGFELGGRFFRPSILTPPTVTAIVVGGGGIPGARYGPFAAFLAGSGIPVLTFDYRGIGESRPIQLRGFKAAAEDWAEFDCGGAIAYMRSRYPESKLVCIAHSIGTFLIGGAPNVREIAQFIFICAHTGYYGDYLPAYRLPMALLWHVVMPVLTRAFGYFPARLLGLGEDIPKGIAMQWAARRTSDLRPEATDHNAVRAREMLARYPSIVVPTRTISFPDDAFATDAGCERLLAIYAGIRAHKEVVVPVLAGFSSIGHFGFFRRKARALLWPLVLSYIRGPEAGSNS
jgi:predicted alpha/beta hydrolase